MSGVLSALLEVQAVMFHAEGTHQQKSQIKVNKTVVKIFRSGWPDAGEGPVVESSASRGRMGESGRGQEWKGSKESNSDEMTDDSS